jgi:AhpD family alkylhydroperoxidase
MVASLVLLAPRSGLSKSHSGEGSPIRAKVYAEIESMLGLVPTFFKNIPDATLEQEWILMKQVQMAPGPIPNKYRELIGVSVAAATKCGYCIIFHTEMARLHGATEAEIQHALHYTKSTTGWSTYINGSQVDIGKFRKEAKSIVKYVKSKKAEESK